MSHIQNKAMLVNLSVSSWTASKKDRTASSDIKKSKGATEKAGWFNKRLIDPTALEPIGAIEGRARKVHYAMTLPWGDNGDRVLPAAAYLEYTDKIRALRQEFEDAVDKFVSDYPQRVQDARQMLGAMYDPADYPESTQIKYRFGVNIVFTPVPDAADFRVDVGDEAVAEIRKSITESVEQRLKGATRECWNRLAEVVGNMATALADPDKTFRDTLVENIRTLCDVLPKLNITNDADLGYMIRHVGACLLVDVEALRRDKKFRHETAERAADLHRRILPWTSQTLKP